MPSIRHLSILLALACLAMAGKPVHSAESYDNCTGFIDAIPAVIATQGVWCLRHDVASSMDSGHAIRITTNNVTIDCNDFKVGGLGAGDGSTTIGIHALNRRNITVRHCNVRGFLEGIYLGAGSGNLVEDNRLDGNLYRGIFVSGADGLARRNTVRNTGGKPGSSMSVAIQVMGDAIDNVVDGVYTTHSNSFPIGIMVTGDESVAIGNTVRGLVAAGTGSTKYLYVVGAGVTISGNRLLAGDTAAERTGYGVYATSPRTLCINNSVSPMAYEEYLGCDASTGNL